MNVKFTIQRKLFAMNLLGLAFVLALGAIGYAAATRLDGSARHIVEGGSALRTQLQADMAHDALRGDVLSALLAGEKKDADDEKAVRADLAEHAKGFRESIDKLEAMPLGDASRQAAAKVRPALLTYVESAAKAVDLAFTDRAAAVAGMGEFMKGFHVLK